MNQVRTRSLLLSAVCVAGLVLAVGCSSPSAPNQVEDPGDGDPDDSDNTSLLIPSPDRPAPDLLRLHAGQPLA